DRVCVGRVGGAREEWCGVGGGGGGGGFVVGRAADVAAGLATSTEGRVERAVGVVAHHGEVVVERRQIVARRDDLAVGLQHGRRRDVGEAADRRRHHARARAKGGV